MGYEKVKMMVGDEKVVLDPADLFIDLDALTKVLCEHSADYAWWSTLFAKKKQELRDLSTAMDGVIGAREITVRNTLFKNPMALGLEEGVKVTEAVVSAVMANDETVMASKNKVSAVEAEVGCLKAMIDGQKTNGVILATLGGQRRAEVEAMLRESVKLAASRFRGEEPGGMGDQSQ